MIEIIHSYSRKEAIADGVLKDVSSTAAECGIRYPVALTVGVWAECVAVPPDVEGQDEAGRLWDVLTMLLYAIRTNAKGSEISFVVHVRNDNRVARPCSLRAVCGPGDELEPVITIMLPGED